MALAAALAMEPAYATFLPKQENTHFTHLIQQVFTIWASLRPQKTCFSCVQEHKLPANILVSKNISFNVSVNTSFNIFKRVYKYWHQQTEPELDRIAPFRKPVFLVFENTTSAKRTFGFSDFVDFAWILHFASHHIQDSLDFEDFVLRD